MPNYKIMRISSEVSRAISEILANETDDALMKTITITGCNVAKDLGYAKVYFTSISDIDHKALEKEMKEAVPFIRKFLAEKVDLRHTPQLEFKYDESIEISNKIEHLIEKIHEE